MAPIAKLALVQLIIFVVGLVCIELILRYVAPLPVHGGTYYTRNGAAVRVARDEFRLKPNLEVTHKASEFSAQIHTNELGYRKLAKESSTPQYIFLGDSFTFGHGVSDEETFSYLFCASQGLVCLNLGRSGTSTFDQLRVLKYALNAYHIRPKVVVLVMLTACWISQSGNDLGDNLRDHRATRKTRSSYADARPSHPQAALEQDKAASDNLSKTSKTSFTKRVQRWIGNFEITKRAMLAFSSRLKSSLYTCSDQETIDSALAATKVALNELERLATEFDFDVKVFSIHPYQELDGAFRKTQGDLLNILPTTFEYFGTGDSFRKAHYFPYDGHFNPSGHANMAALMERRLIKKKSENPPR